MGRLRGGAVRRLFVGSTVFFVNFRFTKNRIRQALLQVRILLYAQAPIQTWPPGRPYEIAVMSRYLIEVGARLVVAGPTAWKAIRARDTNVLVATSRSISSGFAIMSSQTPRPT